MSKRKPPPLETPTEDQERAFQAIMAAYGRGRWFLLEGEAGTGKTTLAKRVVRAMLDKKRSIEVTAPTHQAVNVLSDKLRRAALGDVPTRTLQALLSLRPRVDGDKQVFQRAKHAKPVEADCIIVDECSMPSTDLMTQAKLWLPTQFVLWMGDEGQLPPVGERRSPSFDIPDRALLTTPVRQGQDNPVLAAARYVRRLQAAEKVDWSWTQPAPAKPHGVYRPSPDAFDKAVKRAFTSEAFAADPQAFRYIAWRNERVDGVNQWVRRHIYGDAALAAPFVEGERAVMLEPLIRGDEIPANTGEQIVIQSIAADVYRHTFDSLGEIGRWTAELPSWRISARNEAGIDLEMHAARDADSYRATLERLAAEARYSKLPERWKDFHDFKGRIAKLRAIYASTVHGAQGWTFSNVFLDVNDIALRERSNPLECMQLCYTGLTRPTHAAILRCG